jgi:hypothetical protein
MFNSPLHCHPDELRELSVEASVVTLKPAIGGQFKTGHREKPKT